MIARTVVIKPETNSLIGKEVLYSVLGELFPLREKFNTRIIFLGEDPLRV